MRKALFAAALALAAALLAAPAAEADVSASIRWVEADVALRTDGLAILTYKICWTVRSGEMHGFYFKGYESTARFRPDLCVAHIAGETLPLEL